MEADFSKRQHGVKYRHVTYDGGNPAVVATVSGETDRHHATGGGAGRDDPRQAASARWPP
jgi:tripartite-type tricarboxylate transporter receptor subunit TctC